MNKKEFWEELKKVIYIYRLKKVIRYGEERDEIVDTESVAEHIFGMMILANFFLPLEGLDKKLDKNKIYELILFHDIDEIETGDVITYQKTDKDIADAQATLPKIFSKSPKVFLDKMKESFFEYEDKKSPEGKFVYALDKLEPMFHLYFDLENTKKIFKKQSLDPEMAIKDKIDKVRGFEKMEWAVELIFDGMRREGCFEY